MRFSMINKSFCHLDTVFIYILTLSNVTRVTYFSAKLSEIEYFPTEIQFSKKNVTILIFLDAKKRYR